MIDEAAHAVQFDASLGAEQLPQDPWHGRQCLAALGAWPGGHSARQWPRSWYSWPLGEVAEQLVQLLALLPSHVPHAASQAVHAPLAWGW